MLEPKVDSPTAGDAMVGVCLLVHFAAGATASSRGWLCSGGSAWGFFFSLKTVRRESDEGIIVVLGLKYDNIVT